MIRNYFKYSAVFLYLLVFFLAICTIVKVDGQSKADSLEALLNTEASLEVQLSAMVTLSELLAYVDADKAMQYGLSALMVIDTNVQNEQLAQLYLNLGILKLNQYNLEEAEHILSKSLAIATDLQQNKIRILCYDKLALINGRKNNPELGHPQIDSAIALSEKSRDTLSLSSAYCTQGVLYYSALDYPNALKSFERFRQAATAINHLDRMALANSNLSTLYLYSMNYELALKHSESVMRIAEQQKDKVALSKANFSIANVYVSMLDHENSLKFYRRAQVGMDESAENGTYFAGIYINMGKIFSTQNQLDSSLLYIKKGLALLEGLETHQYYSSGLSMYGNALIKANKINEGITYLNRALIIAEKTKQLEYQWDLHEGLAEAYEKIGVYDRALFHYQKFIEMRDSAFSETKLSEVTEIRMNFEFAEKQLRDSLANAQTLLTKDLELTKKKNEQRYILYGLLLMCGILALLYRTYRNQVKASRTIAAEKKEVERQKNRAEQSELKLQELDATKNRLYTNITHEFRTPLTVITGMAAQIKDNPDKWLNDGLDMVERNGHRLLGLVNQMLDLSKLESGTLNLNNKQADVINYLRYLAESLYSFFDSKEVGLHFEADPESYIMDFDEIRMQQIIINLLSNAAKFSSPGDQVYLQVSAEAHVNDITEKKLQITIKDTGAGIKKDDLPFIFDRFYQVDDSTTRAKEGSGIGLALVKELIKLMKGEIRVTSELGIGTTFTILLPISNKAELIKELPPVESINPSSISGVESMPIIPQINPNIHDTVVSQPTLLIIEDNPDVVTYLRSCLEDGYEIHVSVDGEQGINKAFDLVPDVIITDVMMPKKDGFEVCQVLKTDQRTSHIPVVMLTAKADVESKLTGLDKGADAYLSKPFDKKELDIRLKKLLELRSTLQIYYSALAGLTEQTEEIPKPPTASASEHSFVKKMREIVEEHLSDYDFGVGQFSKEANFSASQLNRKLSALTNMSSNQFIKHVRLNEAKKQLKDKSLNISEIAYSVGFNNPGYFGRVFKKEVGMTPLEWRESVVN